MLSFRRAVCCGVGALATLALSNGTASATPILDYQVTTASCFNCATAGSFTDLSSYSGYTFDGLSMSTGVTDAFGNATVSLGTLARDTKNYSQSPTDSDFVLQVSFLLPLGIGSDTDEFVATIFGTQGQPGDLDFDNTFTKYTFIPSGRGFPAFKNHETEGKTRRMMRKSRDKEYQSRQR